MLWRKCCPSRKAAVTDCRRQKGQRRFRLCPLQNSASTRQSNQRVGMRLLCATGEKHTYAETQITLSCEGYEFKTKGKTVVQNGWKSIEELFKACLLYTSRCV